MSSLSAPSGGGSGSGTVIQPLLSGFGVGMSTAPEVSTYTVDSTNLTLTLAGSTMLNTATHDWPLNDAADQAAFTTAADSAGTLPLTAHGSVLGNDEDAVFNQDAAFDGKTGYLTTTGSAGAINPADDFTISAWVKPTALGGVVASQGGADDPEVKLASTAQGTWALSLNTSTNGSGNTYTTISGGHINLGLWTQLTATYNQATGTATLYADGNEIAVGRDTTPPTDAAYTFSLGAAETGTSSTYTSYFAGYMADAETYDAVAVPTLVDTGASEFVPITPTRVIDTRSTSPVGPIKGPVAAQSTTAVQIAGNTTNDADIPATGITAVAVNLTALDTTGGGQLTAYPDGTTRPGTSNVNYTSAGAFASTAVIPVGSDGEIDIYNSSAGSAADILADVSGYYTTAITGQYYFPTGSDRILDTRSYNPQTGNASPLAPGTPFKLPIPATALAANPTLVLNITATNPTSNGDLLVYPGNQTTLPTASALNWATSQTVANLNIAASAAGNGINLSDQATSGTVDLIIDTDGYFAYATPEGQHYTLTHDWPLTDGTGNAATDTVGDNPLSFADGENRTTSAVGAQASGNVLGLDGATQYQCRSA
jgi:Concanavalin A-like lectin/glucanases superfamily